MENRKLTMTLSERVANCYDVLNENDLYIYHYILNNKKEVLKMTIYELAEKCYISHTNIFRFAKKVGLDGFSELKIQLKWELNNKTNSSYTNIKRVVNEYNDIINDFLVKDMENVLEKIYAANCIYIYGTDQAHYIVAQEMRKDFIHTGKQVIVVDGLSEVKYLLMQAAKDDLFIIISQFGNDESAISIAKKLKEQNISSLGIALNYKSELAKLVDYYIGYKTDAIQIEKEGPYYSSVMLFVIVNMLFFKYMEFGFNDD